VRAGGSKPYRCFWKLCGKTLLEWGIRIVRDSEYIDDVVVSTEDSRIKRAAEKYGARVIDRPYFQTGKFPLDLAAPPFNRQKPRSLIHQGQNVCLDSTLYSQAAMSNAFGIVADVTAGGNVQCPLFTTKSVDRLIERFFEDEEAWQANAVYPVPPKLWTVNPKIDRLFPIFHDTFQGLDRQSYPSLYRSAGNYSVGGCGRYMSSESEKRHTYIVVKPEEGLHIHDEEDLALAEFYMQRRLKKERK